MADSLTADEYAAALLRFRLDRSPAAASDLCERAVLRVCVHMWGAGPLNSGRGRGRHARILAEAKDGVLAAKPFKIALDKHKRTDGYRARAKDTARGDVITALVRLIARDNSL